MAYPKGLSWNQNQLWILYHLQHGLTIKQIHDQFGYTVSLCQKIKKRHDEGEYPGKVTEEMIAQAPPPMQFGDFKFGPTTGSQVKNDEESIEIGKNGEEAPTPKKLGVKVGKVYKDVPVIYTTAFQLVNQTQAIPMTNDIHISYILALKNGYEGGFSDWLSFCCRDFWLGRGRNMYAEYAEALMAQEEEKVGEPS